LRDTESIGQNVILKKNVTAIRKHPGIIFKNTQFCNSLFIDLQQENKHACNFVCLSVCPFVSVSAIVYIECLVRPLSLVLHAVFYYSAVSDVTDHVHLSDCL